MMIRELRLEVVVAGSNFALPSYSVGAFNDRESTLIERAVSSVFFFTSYNHNNIYGRLPLEVYLPQNWA